ncbi:MAG: 30S ribosomal protein S6 [Bdellovibrionota bacterium]
MSSLVERPLQNYEAIIILHPDVNETEQKALFKRNAETIQSFKGRVNHLDTWGKRRLANPVKKMKMGNYFHTTFEAKAEAVAEIERLLGIDDRVLRFFHTKLDDRKSLSQYVEDFKKTLADSVRREQEKDAKRDARKAASAGMSNSDRRPRRGRDDDEEGSMEDGE